MDYMKYIRTWVFLIFSQVLVIALALNIHHAEEMKAISKCYQGARINE